MPRATHITTATRRWALAIAIASGICAWLGLRGSEAAATPPAPAPAQAAAPAGSSASVPPSPAPATAVPDTARIVFTTMPPANATVTWGGTRLGRIRPGKPLVVVRPRDSGPLDVIVRAPGYLPVQTRAHTFADTKLLVQLTLPDQKNTLLGYREPLDAGVPDVGDGGVPPALSDMPPSLSDSTLSPSPSPAPDATPPPSFFESVAPAAGP